MDNRAAHTASARDTFGRTASGVDGVILAAGFSTRAGAFKPILEIGGLTVIEWCLASMSAVCGRVIVVTGYRSGSISAVLKRHTGVEMVYNPGYGIGMHGSVRKGMAEVRTGRFFLIPGDCPAVRPRTYRALLEMEGEIVVPTYTGCKGHPVLLDRDLVGPFLCERDRGGLEGFIAPRGPKFVPVDDPGILMDLDTADDYERLKLYLAGKRPGWSGNG